MYKFLKVRCKGYGVRRAKTLTPYAVHRTPYLAVTLYAVLCTVLLCGCVRLSGGAGYWKTGADGETAAKKVGFDTADYVPGSPAPGKITT